MMSGLYCVCDSFELDDLKVWILTNLHLIQYSKYHSLDENYTMFVGRVSLVSLTRSSFLWQFDGKKEEKNAINQGQKQNFH